MSPGVLLVAPCFLSTEPKPDDPMIFGVSWHLLRRHMGLTLEEYRECFDRCVLSQGYFWNPLDKGARKAAIDVALSCCYDAYVLFTPVFAESAFGIQNAQPMQEYDGECAVCHSGIAVFVAPLPKLNPGPEEAEFWQEIVEIT